ncbi:umecyanin-like [Tripterygium wilfordii]|nr:umecyanin-like [Tripterygium wilfordii]
MVGIAVAETHVVGGDFGWFVPPNKTFYEDWAKNRTFKVGDKLRFPHKTGANNVAEVSKSEYEKCSQGATIRMHADGPALIDLKAPGDYYFYSSIGLHCEVGQKLHITVTN